MAQRRGAGAGMSGRTVMAVVCAALLALSCACLASCTTQPPAETTHLTIKVPRTGHDVVFDESISYADQVLTRLAESFEQSYDRPVDLEVEVFEQNQYDSAIVDCFDTDKAPDVLYGDYFNMSTYIYTGRVVPLDDVVTSDVRASVFDHLWDMSIVDDRIYMLPYLSRQNVLAYNKDLFRQAGLDAYIDDSTIQSWTLDEWTHILDTLADKLSESTFPMMMYAKSSQGDTHIMTLLRAAGSDFFDEQGHFNIATPEGIAALEWIRSGVERGWFPPHSENLEIEDCSSLFRQGQLAIYMVNNASIGRYGDSIGLVNFPGADGRGCATTFISGFEVFDNGDPDKVQVAKDFLSYVFANEELMSYAAGTLPASRAVAERYGDEILAFSLFSDNRESVVDFTGSNPDTRAVREVFYQCIHELLMGNKTAEETARAIDERCNQAIDEGIAAAILHE